MTRLISILTLTGVFFIYWYRYLLTPNPLPSVDLPGHISLMEFYLQHHLNPLGFYDPRYFGGYPALTFYGPLSTVLTALAASAFGLTVQHSANYLMVVGFALMPFVVAYAAYPFYREQQKGDRSNKAAEVAFALWCGFISFWFLNHDSQWHGIGAAAVTNVGLYSQLFAWFPLLAIVGVVSRFAESRSRWLACALAVLMTMLFYTHALTFVFAAGYAVFFGIIFRSTWIFAAPFFSIILSLPYSYYFISQVGEYAPFDIYDPRGDILSIIFRYPPIALWEGVKTALLNGWATWFSAFEILLYPLIATVILSNSVKDSKLLRAHLFFIFVSALVTGSQFVSSGLGLSLHYYRFISLILLVFLPTVIGVIFAAIPKDGRGKVVGTYLMVFFAGVCFITQIKLPHYELERIKITAQSDYLDQANDVVARLSKLPPGARVMSEYFSDYGKFPFLSAHYIESEIVKGGIENAGGLFVQSAPTNKLISAYLEGLGGRAYHVSEQIVPANYQTPKRLLSELVQRGVTHILGFSEKLRSQLNSLGAIELFSVGPYFLFEVGTVRKISQVSRPLLGYFDEKGDLPFRLVDQYFAEDPDRLGGFELVELASASDVERVQHVLLNSESNDVGQSQKPTTVINYRVMAPIRHYKPGRKSDRELVDYQRVKDFLKNIIVKAPEAAPEEQIDNDASSLTISEDGQQIQLKNLIPGQAYRLVYSYMPFWSGAEIFRGGFNQMVVLAHKESEVLTYK